MAAFKALVLRKETEGGSKAVGTGAAAATGEGEGAADWGRLCT